MAGESILARLAVQITANNAKFLQELQQTRKGLDKFTGGLTKIAGAVGLAFGVREVARFGLEVAKLAGEAEGVSAAFDRLPDSSKLMEDLREATHDTVSELDLMKRSVQAANFGIALGALPKLLEFASLRAQQTGQSVDYLVDSIVTGIGRKSPLILDNLGISAVALREKMNGVSLATASVGQVAEAVGAIASENLATMGEFSDNTATRVQKLNSAWENFKVTIGDAENGTGFLGVAVQALTDALNNFGSTSDRASVQTRELASEISAGFDTDQTVARLTRLRKELETPIRFNINAIAAEFDLTEQQAEEFQQKMFEINQALSFQEKAIQRFTQFAQRGGYENLTDAGEAFKQKIYEIILAQQIEQEGYRKSNDAANGAFTQTIDGITKEISQYRQLIDIVNQYVESQTAVNAVTTETSGLVETLEARIKELGESIKKAASVGEITRLQQELDLTKTKLDFLLKPLTFPEIEIEFEFPTSEEIVAEINQLRIEAQALSLANPEGRIYIPVDFVIDPESTAALEETLARDQERFREYEAQIASTFQGITDIVASSTAEAIRGQKDFASALGGITLDVIDLYLKQALAAAIASALASGGPLPVGLALAAVGIAAVKALFSSIGGGSGAGGSSASAAATARPAQAVNYGQGIQVEVIGELKAAGQDLVAVMNNQGRRDNRTRG